MSWTDSFTYSRNNIRFGKRAYRFTHDNSSSINRNNYCVLVNVITVYPAVVAVVVAALFVFIVAVDFSIILIIII